MDISVMSPNSIVLLYYGVGKLYKFTCLQWLLTTHLSRYRYIGTQYYARSGTLIRTNGKIMDLGKLHLLLDL